MYPVKRREGLLVERLDDEIVVYDRTTHKAHCLTGTTAAIWDLCDGRTSPPALADRLDDRLENRLREETVRLILKDLQRARLLEGSWQGQPPRYTRRELMGRLKTAGIALGVLSSVTAASAQALTRITQGQCNDLARINVGKCCTNGKRCQANGKCQGAPC